MRPTRRRAAPESQSRLAGSAAPLRPAPPFPPPDAPCRHPLLLLPVIGQLRFPSSSPSSAYSASPPPPSRRPPTSSGSSTPTRARRNEGSGAPVEEGRRHGEGGRPLLLQATKAPPVRMSGVGRQAECERENRASGRAERR
jgi:hypothetical protein